MSFSYLPLISLSSIGSLVISIFLVRFWIVGTKVLSIRVLCFLNLRSRRGAERRKYQKRRAGSDAISFRMSYEFTENAYDTKKSTIMSPMKTE